MSFNSHINNVLSYSENEKKRERERERELNYVFLLCNDYPIWLLSFKSNILSTYVFIIEVNFRFQ